MAKRHEIHVAYHDHLQGMPTLLGYRFGTIGIQRNELGFCVLGPERCPLMEILRFMRDKKYNFPTTIELNYDFPEGSDAAQEVKKCLEFCRNTLS